MKDPKEYLGKINSFTTRKELYSIGKQMQIDAYNEALDDAVKSVKTKRDVAIFQEGSYEETIVDKKSILELKK